jgi:phosphoenolpyruvate-protein kinase (PTS system EI component)
LEEQVETYLAFIQQTHPAQLTLRALDAGGDKPLVFLPHPAEDNPFLGMRGVRLLINEPTILRTQYRALQIAVRDHGGAISARFMLPMIATVEELLTVRRLIDELNNDLPAIPLGVMIEVPSAALLAHELARYADFFSIGTNDLAQYTLATDRGHRTIGSLADPLHPAVLRLISMTCRAAETCHIPVSLCGEIAGDPAATPLLVGLGVRELSAPVRSVALVKAAVRRHSSADCVELAQRALGSVDAESVRRLLASSRT